MEHWKIKLLQRVEEIVEHGQGKGEFRVWSVRDEKGNIIEKWLLISAGKDDKILIGKD